MSNPTTALAKLSPGDASDALWDANDVARYLKVSRSWVYHRAEAGLLPYLRIGGLLRFDPVAIRSFARDSASVA
jgi:excisionase family DNA binding protein